MIAPPRPPAHDELELLIKEARERQLRRRLLGAAGVAIAAAIGLSAYAWVTGGSVSNVAQPPASGGRATGPLCRASQLSATAFMEGATGSMLGEATLTNTGVTACSLPSAAPRVRITWRGRVLPARQAGDVSVDGATPVRVLAPGSKAAVYMQWREWCGQPTETTTFRPVFQLHFRSLAVNAKARAMSPPRCDAPGSGARGSTIAVSRPLIER
jgi:hypothetical protein